MKHQNPKSKWFRQFFYFSLSPTFCDKNSYYLLLWVTTVEKFFFAIIHCTCWKGCWPWEMFSVILGNSLMKCERSILDRAPGSSVVLTAPKYGLSSFPSWGLIFSAPISFEYLRKKYHYKISLQILKNWQRPNIWPFKPPFLGIDFQRLSISSENLNGWIQKWYYFKAMWP